MKKAGWETLVGAVIGLSTPWFVWAVIRKIYPDLPPAASIESDLWAFLLLRLFTFGVLINAGLFFTALAAKREGMALGLLTASLLYVLGVVFWRWSWL